MPQRVVTPIRYKPSGGMNLDSDPLDQQLHGDYERALNMHVVTRKGLTSDAMETATGNTKVYQLPTVTTQNKKFRIFLQVSAIVSEIRFFDGNKSLLQTASAILWSSNTSPLNAYNHAVTAISTAVFSIPQNIIIGPLVTTSLTAGYFDLEITTVPFWEYTISISDPFNGANVPQPIIIQEAIDQGLVGNLKDIYSFDLNGDLFVWSAVQDKLPETRLISNVIWTGSVFRVFTNVTGIVNNSSIDISDSDFPINGNWIVNVNVGLGYIDLLGSTFSAGTGAFGNIIVFAGGVGEIGVAQRDDNNATWSYTTLLRSKEFNFNVLKKPRGDSERNNINASHYWTDFFNNPRVFYYKGAYMLNGALNFINPNNIYSYGSINDAIRLFVNTQTFDLKFTSQDQAAGNVLAGNWRYCTRLLTANLVPTPTTDVTQEIPVFSATTLNSQNQIGGNDSTTATGKINNFLLTGLVPNLFKWVELIGIQYVNGVPVATIIRRDLLTGNTTQIIQHTGNETNTQAFDLANLSSVPTDIQTALNMTITDNHLVMSNTTSGTAIDFSAWTKTWKHQLINTVINPVGSIQNGSYGLGEYANPDNCYQVMGRMHNETYAEGAKFKLKNGFVTDTFWIDFIRIDVNPTNLIANPADNRRVPNGGLPTYNLTAPNANGVNVAGIEFSNINVDFIVDGHRVRDLVDEIIFERVDLSDTDTLRDVIATGVIIKGVNLDQNQGGSPNQYTYTANLNFSLRTDNFGIPFDAKNIVEYYGASGWAKSYLSSIQGYNRLGAVENYNSESGLGHIRYPKPQYGFFYSPDLLFGEEVIAYRPNDFVYNYGSPRAYINSSTPDAVMNIVATYCQMMEYDGDTFAGQNSPTAVNLDSVSDVGQGGSFTMPSTDVLYRRLVMYNHGAPMNILFQNPSCPVLHVAGGGSFTDVNTNLNTDFGLHYIQYIRPHGSGFDKYGDTRLLKYIPTGFSFKLLAGSPSIVSGIRVFGGDVFTQKTYIKNSLNIPPNVAISGFTISGGGRGIGIYSQNRVNAQMRDVHNSPKNWQYPFLDFTRWLEDMYASGNVHYNPSYTIKEGVTIDPAYDPTAVRADSQPSHIPYSDDKPNNSVVDNYRIFLPLNFRDEDLSNGPITGQQNSNGHLVTFQPLNFVFQKFNETGLLTSSVGDVVFGNAGIMTTKGDSLSTYGTKHGRGICKGKTNGGKDSLYWIDTTHGKIVRHDPSQGTTVLSDIHTMRAFANNNFNFADLDADSICAVWDDQNSEALWSVRAMKKVAEWDVNQTYGLSSEVVFGVSGFNQIPDIYLSATAGNKGNTPGQSGAWTKIDHSDPDYYNYFTLAFNEEINKFSTFYSFIPKIYLKRGKYFLSPRPVGNESLIYEHYHPDSEIGVWYKDGASEQAENWYISGMIINHDANINKHAMATLWQTQVVPERVDVESLKFKTFMLASDFSTDHDQFKCPVKNDTLTANNLLPVPVSEQDTSFIFGSYFKFTLSGSPRIYQKFYNFICKVRNMTRFYNS